MNFRLQSPPLVAAHTALALLVLAPASWTGIRAQDDDGRAARFVRAMAAEESCLFLAQTDGPARLAETFAAVDAVSMVEDLLGRPLLEAARDAVLEDGAQAWEDPEARADVAAFVESYRGRLSVAMLGAPPYTDDLTVAALLGPHPSFDVARIGQRMRESAERDDTTRGVRTLRAGGGNLEVTVFDGRPTRALAASPGGGLLVVMTDAEDADSRILGLVERAASAVDSETAPGADDGLPLLRAPLGLAVHGGRLVRAVGVEQDERLGMTDEAGRDALRVSRELMIEALGFGNLGWTSIALRPLGRHLALDVSARADGAPDPLDLFVPERPAGPDAFARLAPRARGGWATMRFDVAGIVERVYGFLLEEDPERAEAGLEQFRAATGGLDLLDDVLPLVGPDWIFALPAWGLDVDAAASNPLALTEGLLAGVSVEDPARVRDLIDRQLRAAGLHAARRSTDYRGETISSLALAVAVHFAVTDRHLIVALGRDGADELRATLDRYVDAREGLDPADFADPAAERLAALPDGAADAWQSISWFQVPIDSLVRLGRLGAPFVPDPDFERGLDAVEGAAEPLRRFGLEDVLVATRRRPGVLRQVLIW